MALQAVAFRRINVQQAVLLGVIFLLGLTFSLMAPAFLSTRNLTNVLMQVAVVVIIASAANLLMITGNFDLSIGSVLAFSGILYAYLSKHGFSLPAAALATCVVAGLWGLVNGFTVAGLGITPVIATIGTMYAARGFAFLIARWDGGANITQGLPSNFTAFGRTLVFGQIPIIIPIMVVVVLVFLFIEKKTTFGRYAYVIGCNKSAAKLSGVNDTAIVFILYITMGVLAGFCGIIQVSQVGLAAPNIAQGLEFDVVVAIVLGGTSMLGGEGSIIGMLLGALIVGLAANGLNLIGVSFFYQEIIKGLLLMGAVFVDQRIRRAR